MTKVKKLTRLHARYGPEGGYSYSSTVPWHMVSSTSQPRFTHQKEPVPIVQEAGWVRRMAWMGGKSHPHWDSIPDHPGRSQSLYRLSYPAHPEKSKNGKYASIKRKTSTYSVTEYCSI